MFEERAYARAMRAGAVSVLLAGAFALCAASASAVIVESNPGKRLSYTPLTGAPTGQANAPHRAQPFSQCYGAACGSVALQPCNGTPGAAPMPSTTNYFIYWDPKGASVFPEGYKSGITSYFKDLAADSGSDQSFYSVLTQYYGGFVEGGNS